MAFKQASMIDYRAYVGMEVERLDLYFVIHGGKGMHGLGEGRIMFNHGFGGVGWR